MTWILVFLLQPPAFADTQDLRAKAMHEVEQPGVAQDPQAAGMLKLQDPNPPPEPRGWDYFIQLSAQPFQPKGTLNNGLTGSQFQLEATGPTIMGAVELGFRAPLYRGEWSWSWGLAGRAGYANQNTSALFATGYRDTGVRLDTTMLSLAPFVNFTPPNFHGFSFNLGVEAGMIDYSQSSSDALANVNTHSSFDGFSLGAEYNVFAGWTFLLTDSVRSLTGGSQNIALQKNTIELGTKVLW